MLERALRVLDVGAAIDHLEETGEIEIARDNVGEALAVALVTLERRDGDRIAGRARTDDRAAHLRRRITGERGDQAHDAHGREHAANPHSAVAPRHPGLEL